MEVTFINVICIADVLDFKQKSLKMFRLQCSKFKVPGLIAHICSLPTSVSNASGLDSTY